MGRLNAAAILWRKVYDGLITHHGEDHPRVASAAIELAACLPPDFKQPTTPSEAEILSAEGNTVEEDHGEAVSEEDVQEDEGALDWSSLTETLIEDSIQMLRDVLDAIKVEDKGPLKILPPAPPSNHDPTSVNDLWSWYVYMNSINGEVHPETIYALIQVASGLQRHGKHIEAAGHFVDALRVTKERFGSAHIMTTYVVIELGFAFCMTQQKTAEGKALLSEAVNALEQLAESDSRFFLIVLSVRWANLYTVEERLDLVDEMLVQARRNLQILNMTNQRHLHHITLLLSAVRYLQDATSDSDDLLVQALEGLQEKFGDYCSGTREAMMALATVRDFQGRQEETEDLWKQILKSRRGEHGELHQETVSALDHLSNLYCQRMKYVSAYEVQTELLFAAQQLYGDRHPDCAAVMVRVGWTCLRLERMDEAEHLAREAKKILGEVNTHTSANESASELLELSERRIATMVKIDPPERLANPENQQVVMRRPRPLPMERKLGTWDTIEIKAQMGIHKFWELVQKD
ncbi:hypothetical protein FRC17_008863 [Serendipita sp. 399]|nr:hypothetical protein FRC17_008863 [Serendipita sp. 399]